MKARVQRLWCEARGGVLCEQVFVSAVVSFMSWLDVGHGMTTYLFNHYWGVLGETISR